MRIICLIGFFYECCDLVVCFELLVQFDCWTKLFQLRIVFESIQQHLMVNGIELYFCFQQFGDVSLHLGSFRIIFFFHQYFRNAIFFADDQPDNDFNLHERGLLINK